MPGERVATCLRKRLKPTVQVLRHVELEQAAYSGLETCGSVWLCPICSAKISERRRLELGEGVRNWEGQGQQIALVTYTIRHKWGDDLRLSVDGLLQARRSSRSGRWAKQFSDRHGMVGSVRALEVTCGRNGWHPHLHELMFVRAGADAGQLLTDLRERWASMVGKAGLRDVNEHGVNVRLADWTVAEYVAKFGHLRTWDVEHEVAKAVVKRGRQGSRSPIGLLQDHARGDRNAGELWRRYAEVFKGRRQLVWSPGLRELLGLAPEENDEEVAGDLRDFPILLAELSAWDWSQVLRHRLRGELLELAGRHDPTAFWELLGAIRKAGADDEELLRTEGAD